MMDEVTENINFPKEEEKILEFWKKIDAFQTSLKQSKSKKRFTFYDGPPFATGLPHYGHILAGTIKDIVPRYAHMTGHHVERRFGWDTHGLPVEYEIDKTLGITGPSDVMAMGIDNYNAECRKIVTRYAKEWEEIIGRLGRWIDFQNDYKTLYPWFMESVWWVFSELWKKGMVYKGVKVMAFSTACSTPLSNFESNQNYKDVVDPAVIISFPLRDDPEVSMIAWTTTPWTLPSNLALCVNPAMDYVKVRDNSTGRVYIMMEARLEALFKKPDEYTVLDKFKGETLKGRAYTPLFTYFDYMKKQGAFHVLCDSFVTSESGTGVVHQAPYFGEDDYRVCLNGGIITEDQDIICPVDETGCFMAPVSDYQGMYIKDADKLIVKTLKLNGRLVHQGTVKHSYPFCWRSETPLIYKAVPCWFIRVQAHAEKLLASNESTYWVPAFVKEKRFANWLQNARDWAVSRNRYWGTPLPIWTSEDGKETVCVGSIEELRELSGVKLEDLHREHVDKVTIPSALEGQPPLKRVPEVFDCWFESGSMPYAQAHYPFERKSDFEENFPADFIAEGIDQTRGWFYTLLVLSTSLFNKPPFKNLIVNGLVLAKDGQKMSKSKKNYPDPMQVVNKYGADSLRLYLINSPVVRAENLRFKEEGVKDILKEVLLPWYNAYRFFAQNVFRYEKEEGEEFRVDLEEITETKSENTMDRWIMSFTQSLLGFVKEEMAAYRLYTVIPKLVSFVDNLTNWYVRTNRRRLKGERGKEECREALNTLFLVLFTMVRVMAPFTPFITEHLYQNLRKIVKDFVGSQETESVHYLQIPEPKTSLIDKKIERVIDRLQQVVVLGRVVRDKHQIGLKYPLREMVVFKPSDEWETDLRSVENYLKEEINIRNLVITGNKDSYGVELKAVADIKQLGPKVKNDMKVVQHAIRTLGRGELEQLQRTGKLQVCGYELVPSDLLIKDEFIRNPMNERFEAADNSNVLVLLDTNMDQSEHDEGTAKEICNRIQKLRKKAHLVPTDEITVYFEVTPSECDLARVGDSYMDMMEKQIKCPLRKLRELPGDAEVIIQETFEEVKDGNLELVITRGFTKEPTTPTGKTPMLDKPVGMPPNKQPRFDSPATGPSCRFVNVKLCDTTPRLGAKGTVASVLLENPVRSNVLDMEGLLNEVKLTFGLTGMRVQLYFQPDRSVALSDPLDIDQLNKQWLYVFTRSGSVDKGKGKPLPCPQTRFVNVEFGGKQGTVMLENPVSDVNVRQLSDLSSRIIRLFDISNDSINVSADREHTKPYGPSCLVTDLAGTTVYVSS